MNKYKLLLTNGYELEIKSEESLKEFIEKYIENQGEWVIFGEDIAVATSNIAYIHQVTEEDNCTVEKLFFVDDVKPGTDFDSYKTPYAAKTWGVRMTKSDMDKITTHGFNPNTTNQRAYNTGYLKAFLGKK